jgi:dephospho-CoA kinase
MLTIGLTGGIGCGKSTAAAIFAELQVPVIDADTIAHQIVAPGQATLVQLLETFGSELQRADGSLDRDALRARVFSDRASRLQLEAIMHPAIRAEMQRQQQAINADYCILVIPLLLESEQQDICDRILVVDCTESTQRSRVMQRPGLSAAQFDAILQAQCSRQQRLATADDIISNDRDDINSLKQQILALHQQYVKMSKNA